jgi:hypothetical protein
MTIIMTLNYLDCLHLKRGISNLALECKGQKDFHFKSEARNSCQDLKQAIT